MIWLSIYDMTQMHFYILIGLYYCIIFGGPISLAAYLIYRTFRA